MNNLTTIISEMIDNELPSLNMDASNHVVDRLSNKIINEVRNSICDLLLSDEVVRCAVSRFLDGAYHFESGRRDMLYIPLGDVELHVEQVLSAAIAKLKGE